VQQLPAVDMVVLVLYVAGMVGFGCWFVRRSSKTEGFMAADRSLPGWAVGLSIFGTYVSSISFLANPGKSFSADWNPFVFGLSLPIAAVVAVKCFVPFYRKAGEISAYSHLEHRFGAWARTYVVICFLLTQIVRIGAIMLLVAIALNKLTGWDHQTIIIVTGVLVTLYTMLGGIEAVIWTDVVQSIILTLGALVCVVLLLVRMPEGPQQVFSIAKEHGKFSLGSFELVSIADEDDQQEPDGDESSARKFRIGDVIINVAETTFWIVLLFGLFENFRNFGIDQSYVQRYITAKTDADAARSVWIGALLFVPISALLFFIGTALFAFYYAQPQLLKGVVNDPQVLNQIVENPELIGDSAYVKGDEVFPHFIVTQLPTGMTGLLIAAIFAAAMSSVDSSLNGSATLILVDIYRRYFRPSAGERESMAVLYTSTLVWGALGTFIAIVLIPVESVLDTWWKLSGILGGGMLGLFLLGYISRRANSPGALIGVVVGLLVIIWMTINQLEPDAKAITGLRDLLPGVYEFLLRLVERMEPYRAPINGLLTIAIGTLTIMLVGMLASRLFKREEAQTPTGE